MFKNQIQTFLVVEKLEKRGLHSFMDWSPEAGSTGCLTFAGGGELLNNLFDRHGVHLLSTPFSHTIS
jgi:hypothetical protein